MPEPRDYRIVLNLKAALQAITGPGFFYHVDLAAVKLDPDHGVEELATPGGPRPFIVIELRDDARVHLPAYQIEYERHYTVHWVHEPAAPTDVILGEPAIAADEDRVRMFERGVSDVEVAVSRDTGRGGLAVDTRIEAVRWNRDAGQAVWAEVDIVIRAYREFGVTT